MHAHPPYFGLRAIAKSHVSSEIKGLAAAIIDHCLECAMSYAIIIAESTDDMVRMFELIKTMLHQKLSPKVLRGLPHSDVAKHSPKIVIDALYTAPGRRPPSTADVRAALDGLDDEGRLRFVSALVGFFIISLDKAPTWTKMAKSFK